MAIGETIDGRERPNDILKEEVALILCKGRADTTNSNGQP